MTCDRNGFWVGFFCLAASTVAVATGDGDLPVVLCLMVVGLFNLAMSAVNGAES